MSRERDAHQPKTVKELREYMETNIREAGPTLHDASSSSDDTDTPQIKTRSATGTLTETQSRLRFIWKEEYTRLIIITLILGLIGWGSFQLYNLNREVGVVKAQITGIENKQKDQLKELEKTENRIRREIETTSSQIDKVEEKVNDLQKLNYTNIKK